MKKLVNYILQIQSLAETGIHYSKNPFELKRNQEINEACMKALQEITGKDENQIIINVYEGNGYKTPKVDVRAVVFNVRNELLMVKEKIDGKWALPGGWADVGFSPSEVAVKETQEEAGIRVKPVSLLAVMDKKCHEHPSDLYYIYKIFLGCEITGEDRMDGLETTDASFFGEDNIPELSGPRNTPWQIKLLFDFRNGIKTPPYFD
jgi:ADP-ribose pyrophosphatase YjhB (NUDIX family)